MKSVSFVDTSAWYSCLVSSESRHPVALGWLNSNSESLITTDYVIDETLTLLRVRGHNRAAIEFGRMMFEESWALIHHVDADDVRKAWKVFEKFADKEWSFTDCVSKVVMDRLELKQAFAFDHHFRQFGVVTVPK